MQAACRLRKLVAGFPAHAVGNKQQELLVAHRPVHNCASFHTCCTCAHSCCLCQCPSCARNAGHAELPPPRPPKHTTPALSACEAAAPAPDSPPARVHWPCPPCSCAAPACSVHAQSKPTACFGRPPAVWRLAVLTGLLLTKQRGRIAKAGDSMPLLPRMQGHAVPLHCICSAAAGSQLRTASSKPPPSPQNQHCPKL